MAKFKVRPNSRDKREKVFSNDIMHMRSVVVVSGHKRH
jgi:hypothetical protein